MIVKQINWDSEFFGFKTGHLEIGSFNINDFEKEKENFKLIYLTESDNNSNENYSLIEPLIDFTDKKVVYSKKLNGISELDDSISEYDFQTVNNEIIKLALQAGEFSRFKMDSNFENNTYKCLYTKWIENSCNKKIAFCVLVCGDINNPNGFITLQKNESIAQVGLFAVSEEFQNNGIGKKLVAAAEFYAKKHNFDTLNITTQVENIKACKLYEKCGYSIESTINTYHHWNKKNEHTI